MASGFHTPSFISRRQFLPSHSRIMSATYLLEERDGSSLITNDTSTPSALLDRSFFDSLHDRFGQHSEELRSERAFPGRATYPSLHRPPHLVRTKKRLAKETLTKEQILLYSAPRVSETEGGVTTVKAYARSSGRPIPPFSTHSVSCGNLTGHIEGQPRATNTLLICSRTP
ncbi:hypothetical protein PM082_016612 [Marasmius tenuissimus]|nr:hypothetical protein PM082_016612 [Marasmius tenuissimus]